ncbi:hypothetical protein LTR37_006440 [Vermiconidia calcicola]|uniref:Uncharacterized protein n=1 Tax=Vermiconidia calcicola TaxID=1690605 RepID=A0ACC3NGL4_9PEZI|nr:hypothetical protein LTR37_006440 [Vermiconidia calcicola]
MPAKNHLRVYGGGSSYHNSIPRGGGKPKSPPISTPRSRPHSPPQQLRSYEYAVFATPAAADNGSAPLSSEGSEQWHIFKNVAYIGTNTTALCHLKNGKYKSSPPPPSIPRPNLPPQQLLLPTNAGLATSAPSNNSTAWTHSGPHGKQGITQQDVHVAQRT